MTRMSRLRLILAVAALFALIAVPMAGARTVDSPAIHPAGGQWIGATLRWVEDLVGLRHPVHSGSKVPHTKADEQPAGGGCIDPMGHPKPLCA